MLVGLFATLVATEPAKADEIIDSKAAQAPLWSARGFLDAVLGAFRALLSNLWLDGAPDARRDQPSIACRIFLRGPITNPFYHDIGLSKDYVGAVRGNRRRGRRFPPESLRAAPARCASAICAR